MMLETWGNVLTHSAQNIWWGVAGFVPGLVLAIVIFFIGWIVAALIAKVVAQIFKAIRVDHALRVAGFEEVVKRAGYTLDSGKFVGGLVKWFVIVVFLVASFDVLGLTQVNIFLADVVLSYLPRVIIAVLMLLVAAVIADTMQKVVLGGAKAAHIHSARFLGNVTRWAIWIFAILTVLFQLGIAAAFVQTLFTGMIVAIALAVGLAFGLGGQSAAADIIRHIKDDVSQIH